MNVGRAGWWSLAAAAVLAACNGPDYPPTSEGLYLRHCSRCHEVDGSSVTSSELAGFNVDLRSSIFQANVPDAEIRQIMQTGVGKMQGIPGLTEAEVDSILLHVRRLDDLARELGAESAP